MNKDEHTLLALKENKQILISSLLSILLAVLKLLISIL